MPCLESKRMPDYDVIVIGAGLSGLSAGIRLAYCGRRVAVFERHWFSGGLNSYYERGGVTVDVGLHAMTNYVPETERQAPMNRLFRQLKLKRASMDLMPQTHSEIRFPGVTLTLDNDPETFLREAALRFPEDADALRALFARIGAYSYAGDEIPETMARAELAACIRSPLLREMILCPVMFYGNPMQGDMSFRQFSILFKSLFLEGMARPHDGMKPFVMRLQEKFLELGGALFLRTGVRSIRMSGGAACGVTLDDGRELSAHAVLSSVGACETARLCDGSLPGLSSARPGEIAFAETIFTLDCLPSDLGLTPAIIFQNSTDAFDFRTPETGLDLRSQIICFPGNFEGCSDIPAARSVRITSLTSPRWWNGLEGDSYRRAKEDSASALLEVLAALSPSLPSHVTGNEVSTPRTITRFTGHVNGAIYGSPDKAYSAATGCRNLYLCGTDQGLLGIIGSMMSGAVVANQMEMGTDWRALS